MITQRFFVQTLPFFRVLPFQHGFSHTWIPWRLIQPAFKPRLDAKGKRHPSSASGKEFIYRHGSGGGAMRGFVRLQTKIQGSEQKDMTLQILVVGSLGTYPPWN